MRRTWAAMALVASVIPDSSQLNSPVAVGVGPLLLGDVSLKRLHGGGEGRGGEGGLGTDTVLPL